jgi:hypothetical protein
MIKSVGNRAIFLGTRSLSVDTDNLPAIEANCIYYDGASFELQQHGVYVHRLEDGSHEKLYEPTDDIALPVPVISGQRQVRPLSLQHVIMDYATCI